MIEGSEEKTPKPSLEITMHDEGPIWPVFVWVGVIFAAALGISWLSEAEQFLANAGLQDTGPCCELSAWHNANCPPFEDVTVQVSPLEEP